MEDEKSPSPPDPLGLTLQQYAAALGKHPQAIRPQYTAMLRQSLGLTLPPITRQQSQAGTIKFCLAVDKDPSTPSPTAFESESVIIPMTSYRGSQWYTLCVSSQIGCRMACSFCETGRMGLLQNLTPAQIVGQRLVARRILQAQAALAPSRPLGPSLRRCPQSPRYFSDGIQNIVFMGMGEPLDNFENVTQAIRVLNDPNGLDFPHAQITVSTVGRIDGLRKLAALSWINLRIAISLNAANDQLRNELMPINKAMPLADLQRVLLEYPLARKGRFLIEYVLIKGVNDSLADAHAVAAWCRPLPCIVNLIPYNPQRFASLEPPSDETITSFLMTLKSLGLFVKRRVTHGQDLMGACGQLGNPEICRQPSTRPAAPPPAPPPLPYGRVSDTLPPSETRP